MVSVWENGVEPESRVQVMVGMGFPLAKQVMSISSPSRTLTVDALRADAVTPPARVDERDS